MSAFEPNTADQNPTAPSPASFMRAARLRAAPWSAIAVASAVWSARSYFLWTTWPTHVGMRDRHLGMDWWLHASWAAAAVAALCLIATVLELALAPRRARRYFEAFQRRMADAAMQAAAEPGSLER